MGWQRIGTLRGPDLSARVSTAADGAFRWALPAGLFKAPPVVTCTVEADPPRDYVATLTSTAADLVVGRVRRSRPLPMPLTLLGALAGYDIFEAPGIVTVYLVARGGS